MTNHHPACSIEWLLIPAPDLERAKAFYATVFHFEITDYSDTFAVFKTGNISGGLDNSLVPSTVGTSLSITVADIPSVLEVITKHGGKVIKPKYALGPNAGFCAKFADPNGNAYELYCDT
ncbi:MAG: VOC family protein [Chloroflexales bacterium]|nr:VOC family protein [Chloroflexales bacterium]